MRFGQDAAATAYHPAAGRADHDVEFAAENADRCALFFDGEILSADVPGVFFSDNNFYTTAANRIARQLYPGAVTCEQVAARCRGKERSRG